MRRLILFALAIAMTACFADVALAKSVQIGGQHTEGEIETACHNAHGHFAGSVGSYTCVTNCCSVTCTRETAKCTGSVPIRGSAGRGRITIGTVLRASPGKTSVKGKRPIKASGTKTAGAVVRDHRHDSSGFDGDVHDHRTKHGGIQEGSGRHR